MDVNRPHPDDGVVLRRRVAALALALLLVPVSAVAGHQVATATGARIDAVLATALATAAPTQPIEAAVVFTSPPSPTTLSLLRATGVTALPLHSLPMAIVRGTRTQLQAAALLGPVASMWG